MISSSWLNQFAKTNSDRQYIHINDNGLTIPIMRRISTINFEEWFTKNSKNYDIENKLHAILQRTKRQDFVYNKSIKMLHQLHESMQRLLVHCKNYLDACENQDDRKQFLEQMEMESEQCFSLLLEPLWEIYKIIILPKGTILSITEIILHRTLFIQTALQVHIPCLQEVLCHKNAMS